MKKIIFGCAILGGLVLVSCKKDYNCVCSAYGWSSVADTFNNHSKKDAESKCEDIEKDLKQSSSAINCSIEKK